MIYVVTQPKRIDEIVYEHYGDLSHIEDIVILNKQYLNKYILEVGDKIELPIYEDVKKDEGVALWD